MTCRELTGILIVCTMLSIGTMNAQPVAHDSTVYTVTTREGMRVDGRLQEWIADTLILITLDGVTVRIPASSIVNLGRGGTPRVPDSQQPQQSTSIPQAEVEVAGAETRDTDGALVHRSYRGGANLFMIPTAYPEDAGAMRLGLAELLFGTAAYGIAGIATAQAGALLFPAKEAFLAHATLKVSPVSGKHGAIAIGGTFISHYRGATTVPFALATVNLGGERGVYATCGAAYQVDTENAILLAGIDVPLSNSLRIVSELFLTKADLDISYVTPGVRFHTNYFDIDAGLVLPLNADGLMFLPWLGASVVL